MEGSLMHVHRTERRRPPLPGSVQALAGLSVWLGLLAVILAGPVSAATETPTERFERAKRVLWAERNARVSDAIRAELEVADPARTGLVGIEWSSLTTTMGGLDAKRATTHGGWVDALRTCLGQLNLAPGDTIAIGSSGSMPAFLLATRIAAESLDLKPVIIASLTSSNFGANLEGFDLMHMEEVLLREGIVRTPIRIITPGGNRDRVHGAEPEIQAHVATRMAELVAMHGAQSSPHPTEPITPRTIREAHELRERVFFAESNCRVFINIGGHAINFGTSARALGLPPGLTMPGSLPDLEGDAHGRSLVRHALRNGIPVIHLLSVRQLAEAWNLPYP